VESNFAGIGGTSSSIVDMDFEKWKKTFDVNTHGVMLCTKHELRQMMKQDSIAV